MVAARLALAALLLTGCFERGKAREHRDDAAVAPTAPAIDARLAAAPTLFDPAAAITVSLEAEPPHLNPLLGDALAARLALGDIYEGLLCATVSSPMPAPCLAKVATVDATGAVWTFELREDVTWHDGTPLTQKDVTFSFGLLSGGAPSLLASEFQDLESVDVDGARIVFRFASVRVGRRGAFARVPILPAHRFARVAPAQIAAAATSRAPVGTGPLRFDEWKPGESISLSRAPAYWGTPSAAARVTYKMYTGREQTIAALRAGQLDVAVQIPVDEAVSASGAPGVELFAQVLPGYYAAVYNTERLGDARVRRALTALLDRPQIVRELFRDQVEIVSGPFFPGSPAEDPDVEPIPFSPKTAAGALSGGKPEASIAVPAGSRTMARVADIWVEDARPHAELSVDTIPYATLLERVAAGKFDIALLAFTTAVEVDLYPALHSSQIGQLNYSRLRDERVDELVTRLRAEPSRERRDEMSRELHRRLHELSVYAYISSDTRLGLRRSDVGGIAAGPFGLAARRLGKRGGK